MDFIPIGEEFELEEKDRLHKIPRGTNGRANCIRVYKGRARFGFVRDLTVFGVVEQNGEIFYFLRTQRGKFWGIPDKLAGGVEADALSFPDYSYSGSMGNRDYSYGFPEFFGPPITRSF